MAGERLLLIEDDDDLAASLCRALEREGYRVDRAASGFEGLERVGEGNPDLVLLDLNLPDLDGLAVCRELRGNPATRALPIIMLTARAAERDRVRGLDLGADDYVVKPFSLAELRSRVRALLRRRRLDGGVPEGRYRDRRLAVDRDARLVELDGRPVRLTARELDLLWFLLTTRPRVVSRERIVERVWGLGSDVDERTVDVHVRALRKKLGPEVIETVIGAGYRFRGWP